MSEPAKDLPPHEVRTPRGVILRGAVGCNGVPLRNRNWAAFIGPIGVSVYCSEKNSYNEREFIFATVSTRGVLSHTMHAQFGANHMDEALAWVDNRIADAVDAAAKECGELLDATKGNR